MAERYGPPTGKWEGHQQEAEQQRTVNDKIARLRQRLKRLQCVDNNVRSILFGILDLLDDEL